MSVPIIQSGYAPTLGASITNVSASLTLSVDSGDNGHVWMLIDSEILDGDKSGTSVTGLNRASEKFNGTAVAASHNAGAVVYMILGRGMFQANAWTKIADSSSTVFPTTTVDWQSIPATFAHLKIIWQTRGDTASTSVVMRALFNNDSGANYDNLEVDASSSSVTAATTAGDTFAKVANFSAASATAGLAGSGEIMIANYAGTTFNKAFQGWSIYATGNTNTTQAKSDFNGKWRTTATAINRISLVANAGNFGTGSLFTLYGLP